MADPKILFLTHPDPNYVPDLLLHGLRELFGADVVDFPRKAALYEGRLTGIATVEDICPELFGQDEIPIDRDDIPAKVRRGFFDFTVIDIRALGMAFNLLDQPPPKLVLIDGEDAPAAIPGGPFLLFRRESDGRDGALPLPMALPKKIFQWIRSYAGAPKTHSIGFLGSFSACCPERARLLEKIAARFPDALLSLTPIPLAECPRPPGRLGRADYYQALQRCKVVLTLRGAGQDTFRYWENMAVDATHVAENLGISIPAAFEPGRHLLTFSDVDEMRGALDAALEDDGKREFMTLEKLRHLEKFHLTTGRAKYFLDHVNRAFRSGTR